MLKLRGSELGPETTSHASPEPGQARLHRPSWSLLEAALICTGPGLTRALFRPVQAGALATVASLPTLWPRRAGWLVSSAHILLSSLWPVQKARLKRSRGPRSSHRREAASDGGGLRLTAASG